MGTVGGEAVDGVRASAEAGRAVRPQRVESETEDMSLFCLTFAGIEGRSGKMATFSEKDRKENPKIVDLLVSSKKWSYLIFLMRGFKAEKRKRSFW